LGIGINILSNFQRLLVSTTAVLLSLFFWLSSGFAATDVVRPGMVLKITVAGHPEFTETVFVEHDGTTSYPLLLRVPLDGLTAVDIQDLIRPSLLKFEREPEVYVSISEAKPVKTQVYGAVKQPGRFDVEGPLNLQQLIAMAGNVTEEADPARIRIFRTEAGRRNEIFVDLTLHFHSDSLVITPEIEDGDIVVVPCLTPSTSVRVFGQVIHPGEVYIGEGDNLYDAIQRAGGFTPSADSKRVKHFTRRDDRYGSGEYNVDLLLRNARISELPLAAPGDIVVVPQREGWRELNWWMITLRDFAYLASTLIVLIRIL